MIGLALAGPEWIQGGKSDEILNSPGATPVGIEELRK
jgi:hypothetical protein